MARLTYANPKPMHPHQKQTYRIPTERIEECSFKTFGRSTAMYGNIADKLGRYEDLGEPEELAKKLGVRLDG